MKPLERHCIKLCKDYPCDKVECGRVKGYKNGGPIQMVDEQFAYNWNKHIKVRLFRESRATKENGNNFERARMI